MKKLNKMMGGTLFRMATVLFVAALALNAQARAVGDLLTFNGLKYKVTKVSGGFEVGINGAESSVVDAVFPSTVYNPVDGTTYNVTSILARAFENNNTLKTVKFSEGVVSIASSSFWNTNSMVSVDFPASLTSYANSSIRACQKLVNISIAGNINGSSSNFKCVDGVLYSADGTTLYCYGGGRTSTTFNIPAAVTTLKEGSIMHNSSLSSLTISAGLTTIETGALSNLPKMTSFSVASGNTVFEAENGLLCKKTGSPLGTTLQLVAFPMGISGVYKIPSTSKIRTLAGRAVNGARELVELDLSDTKITSAGATCFEDCSKLERLKLPSTFTTIGTTWLNASSVGVFISFPNGNNKFEVLDSALIMKIDNSNWELCYYPWKNTDHCDVMVTLAGRKITSIHRDAFRWNRAKKVTIGKQVKTIGVQAFYRSYIEEVVFEEGSVLESMANQVFYRCYGLKNIVLPASLKTIGNDAFKECGALETVTFSATSQLTNLGTGVFADSPNLRSVVFENDLAPNLTTIPEQCFQNCPNLETFTIPTTITKIETSAFNGCNSMHTVTFVEPSTITTIGHNAFQNSGLVDIELPHSVTRIENEAFKGCTQLESIEIPAATTYVGAQAFLVCSKLKAINVDTNNPNYATVDGMLASKDNKTLIAFPAGKANRYITLLSPAFTAIGDSAFFGCNELLNVTIPEKVDRIGKDAFHNCRYLNAVAFLTEGPIAAANIGPRAFGEDNAVFDNADFTIYVRKNGREDEYQATGSYWKGLPEKYSFIVDTEEYFPMSHVGCNFLKTTNTNAQTLVIPRTATNPDDGLTYTVAMMGDYAFEEAPDNIDEVVIFGPIQYIGAKSFRKEDGSSKIKNIFFVGTDAENIPELSTIRFNLAATGDDYNEFTDEQNIYVKKAVYHNEDFIDAIGSYYSQVDYKIPGISLKNTYGTFAREFDVDLADYYVENGNGRVFAFTSAPDKTFYEGKGDGSTEGTWYIRMYSINEGQNGDGTYIPANTGVMLKSMGGAATPSGFYYTIGDSTTVNLDIADDVMVGVTVSTRDVEDPNKDIYVMSGGVFKPLNGKTVTNFPIHKAYLQLPSTVYPGSIGASAKLVFLFDNDSPVVSSLDTLEAETSENQNIFDLQGRRVSAPQKGIYIKNGKKIIVK